jgi:NAD(P)-dependent dehydrogenase (short-subunit alcohol dehydrogenase family)
MVPRVCILTGASRGLGLALAGQLLAPDTLLLCLSRQRSDTLAARAAAAGARLEQWQADLADGAVAANRLQAWLAGLDAGPITAATLINNAAAITRVGPVDACRDAELTSALRVGLEAPLLLSAAFLRATRDWHADKRVLNISSGLGRRAMAGSAPYCAVKAGLDNLSRAMALDEAQREHGARIVSLAPGVIDTDMQVQLRSADPDGFPDRSLFVQLKESGQLSTPADAAARVLAYLRRADFGSQPLADVRDA